MQTLLQRPIQNIKNVDFGAIGFVGFFMSLLLFWVIPVEMLGAVDNAFSFMFSFQMLEPIEIQKSSDPLIASSLFEDSRTQSLNQIYTFMNWSKVILWSMTIIFLIRFLFKNPVKQ